MKTKVKKLPDKPSALIRMAIKDLKVLEKNPSYVVDMGSWHHAPIHMDNYRCEICLAGAVMAKELKVPIEQTAYPEDFGIKTCTKLIALNSFRRGCVASGLYKMGFPLSLEDRNITSYTRNSDQFKIDMLKLADDLEKAKL